MTPELSRELAHILNDYRKTPDRDLMLCSDFVKYVYRHEADINSLKDIPKKYDVILKAARPK